MSVGKILRKIVKKWLRKDSETGVGEPTDFELYTETTRRRRVPLATTAAASHLHSEQPCLQECLLCIEQRNDDGTTYAGDLNRNVHISDEMGYSSSSDDYRKCRRLDDWDCELSETSYSSSCPLHGGGLSNFMGGDNDDPTEFPFDHAPFSCHSSQSPVPLCVCETCYIFVSSHLSLRLPSASPARRTAAAADAAGQPPPLWDAETARCWADHVFPTGQTTMDSSKVSSKTVIGGVRTTVKERKQPADYNEHSSISVTSNRRFHSVMNPKSPICCSVEKLPKTTTMGWVGGVGGPVDLPRSVHVSLDGEEGFVEGQRRLRCINRWEDAAASAAHKSFRPPPNKTICHVAK